MAMNSSRVTKQLRRTSAFPTSSGGTRGSFDRVNLRDTRPAELRPHPRPFSIVAKGANAGEGIFLFGGAIPKDPRNLKDFKDLNDAPPKNKLG